MRHLPMPLDAHALIAACFCYFGALLESRNISRRCLPAFITPDHATVTVIHLRLQFRHPPALFSSSLVMLLAD